MNKSINQGGKRLKTFTQISDSLISSQELTANQKLIISYILRWQMAKKKCTRGNRSLARFLGISEKCLKDNITKLNKFDFFSSRETSHRNEFDQWINSKMMEVDEELLNLFLNKPSMRDDDLSASSVEVIDAHSAKSASGVVAVNKTEINSKIHNANINNDPTMDHFKPNNSSDSQQAVLIKVDAPKKEPRAMALQPLDIQQTAISDSVCQDPTGTASTQEGIMDDEVDEYFTEIFSLNLNQLETAKSRKAIRLILSNYTMCDPRFNRHSSADMKRQDKFLDAVENWVVTAFPCELPIKIN